MHEVAPTVVPFVGLVPALWRNGGGLTREVAVGSDPRGRLSIASLSRGGPFSYFPDQDRTFLVASSAGIDIDVDGVRQQLEFGQSLAFAGGGARFSTVSTKKVDRPMPLR